MKTTARFHTLKTTTPTTGLSSLREHTPSRLHPLPLVSHSGGMAPRCIAPATLQNEVSSVQEAIRGGPPTFVARTPTRSPHYSGFNNLTISTGPWTRL